MPARPSMISAAAASGSLSGVEGLTSATRRLRLPHPRAHERAFVLVPWAELEPRAVLPQGRILDLLDGMDASGVVRTDPPIHPRRGE